MCPGCKCSCHGNVHACVEDERLGRVREPSTSDISTLTSKIGSAIASVVLYSDIACDCDRLRGLIVLLQDTELASDSLLTPCTCQNHLGFVDNYGGSVLNVPTQNGVSQLSCTYCSEQYREYCISDHESKLLTIFCRSTEIDRHLSVSFDGIFQYGAHSSGHLPIWDGLRFMSHIDLRATHALFYSPTINAFLAGALASYVPGYEGYPQVSDCKRPSLSKLPPVV